MRSQQEVRANRCNNPFDFPILKNYFGDQERKYSTMNQLWSNEWDSSFKSLHFDPHMAMINAIRVSDTWMIYVFLFHFDEIKKRWKKGMSRSDKFKTQYRNFPDEIDLSYRKGIGQTILEIAWVEVQRQPEHYIIIVLLFAYGADIDYIMPGVWDDFSGNVRTKQKYCETLVHKLTTIRNKAREKEGKLLPYNTQWRD